jgi:hypothetical protein
MTIQADLTDHRYNSLDKIKEDIQHEGHEVYKIYKTTLVEDTV